MMSNFLISLEKALPILVIIFIVVLCLILITRLVFAFLMHQARKRYDQLKKTTKKYVKIAKKDFKKTDEELLRKKDEIPRAHSALKAEALAQGNKAQSGSYELMISKEQELEQEQLSEINIVDIVKPIGFWTSMILGQKLTYLIQSAQIINKRGKQGFWVSMIEAKEREAGKQHARGR